MTASALARRLITLICAGRNRMAMIRRELPRTSRAGWVRRPCRIVFVEGSPFVGPRLSSALLTSKISQAYAALVRLNCASVSTAIAHMKPSNSRASAVTV